MPATPTTAHTAINQCVIELSTDGTTWTRYDGETTGITGVENTRQTGTAYTFANDYAHVSAGKYEPAEVTITGLYTEETDELFNVVHGYYTAGTDIYFRYAPKGVGATGRFVFTASKDGVEAHPMHITSFQFPEGEASTADPVPFSFSLIVPTFVRTTTAGTTGLGSA